MKGNQYSNMSWFNYLTLIVYLSIYINSKNVAPYLLEKLDTRTL